jgi:CO/xanthine dehydrogenase FAD-binding subunit
VAADLLGVWRPFLYDQVETPKKATTRSYRRCNVQAFDYVAARSIDDAVDLLSANGGGNRVLAGGTDLLIHLREGRLSAVRLVDIKLIPELNVLTYDPEIGLHLGAAVPCVRIHSDPKVAELYPGLIDAVSLIGGIQIQGRASLGGNLGNASPAGDTIPALIAHRAVCEIAGPGGLREVAAEDFCTAPGQTVLRQGEFLVALRIPSPPPGFGASYLRFIPRNEMDIAVAGAGASVELDPAGQVFVSARVALAAVAPTPLFVPEAGEALVGRSVSEEVINTAARVAQEVARPISDVRGTAAQRKHLAAVLTRRALRKAVARAQRSLGEVQE